VQEVIGGANTANSLTGGIDEVFQRTDSAGARSFLTDAWGNSIALADSSGAIQTQYTFDPFGSTTPSGTSNTNSFAYTGRELDATGIYFYRARYYNPQLHRFISEDPGGLFGGINFYRYADDNPVSYSDPFGLDITVVQYQGAGGFGHVGIGVNSSQTEGFYPLHMDIPIGATGLSFDPYYLAPIAAPGGVLPNDPNDAWYKCGRLFTLPRQSEDNRIS